ncbi:hypothetical protein VTL71DRAFT_13278 [Oculimacula yallundae]|uniref:Amidoligase enzyme n=1 Tax=Oculimacula yallundae TaxID=86028 RepID=A0ABR4CJW4_9HELO
MSGFSWWGGPSSQSEPLPEFERIRDPDDDFLERNASYQTQLSGFYSMSQAPYARTEQRSLTERPDPSLGFGIEIEAIVKPRGPFNGQTPWEALAMRMKQYYKLDVTWYKPEVKGTWKNTRYDAWHVTYDSSLELETPDEVSLEVVAPKLQAGGRWEGQIELVWKAIRDLFRVKKHAISCGSHVHVAPVSRVFTLDELKLVAMFTIIHEDSILKILHTTRQNHKYCERNTKIGGTGLWDDFGEVNHSRYKSAWRGNGLKKCQQAIAKITTKSDLVAYVQGTERRVLWNFRNILPGGSGTVEFRGGRHLRGPKRTISWATFTIVFIDLALRSVSHPISFLRTLELTHEKACLNPGRYDLQYVEPHLIAHDEATHTLWKELRTLCDFQAMTNNLPEKVTDMSEVRRNAAPCDRFKYSGELVSEEGYASDGAVSLY